MERFGDHKMKKTNEVWKNIVVKCREKVKERYPELYASLDFGVYFSPSDYFVSFIFFTNKELEDAKESGLTYQINEYFKDCMKENGYPIDAIEDCDFASQEQCEKEYSGNWFYYYK